MIKFRKTVAYSFLMFLIGGTSVPPTVLGQQLRIYPSSIQLDSVRDSQAVVASYVDPSGTTIDVTEQIEWHLSDSQLARLHGARLLPMAAGQTELQATWNQHTSTIPVHVAALKDSEPVNFRLDVVPIFTKTGCNSGSCHGSSRGQDGFRLSLFGFDPAGDYFRVTREMGVRRLNLALPEKSLLLEKAAGIVPHTGGKRLELDGSFHQTICQWLEEGAADANDPTPTVDRVTVAPSELLLRDSGQAHQLLVTAYLSDGTTRDVTDLAVYYNSDPATVEVDKLGLVAAKARGESYVTCRFDVHTVGIPVFVLPENDSYQPPPSSGNYVDALVGAKLKKLRYMPAPLCSDAEYLRRITIDLNGRLPTTAELEGFLSDTAEDKRKTIAATLIERDEFLDVWTAYWADTLLVKNSRLIERKPAYLYHAWLKERLASGTRIDELVRELLTVEGSTFREPASNFFAGEPDRKKVAENVAQAFLGIRVQCAQCHNHPFDRWTMDDYYGFAAFFHHVTRKRGEDYREWIVYRRAGEMRHPVTNKNVPPKFLGGATPEQEKMGRREVVAAWITSPDNPYFAKNIANRLWSLFFGQGIVEPVDDIRISNPPTNLQLYEALAERLISYDFDVKRLVLDIVQSDAYGRSCQHPTEAPITRDFGRAQYRRLPAAVLLDCVSQVTQSSGRYRGLDPGDSAINIPIEDNYFLRSFGRSDRDSVCACESDAQPTLSQALHLLNGETTNKKIRDGKLVESKIAEGLSVDAIIDDLYLRCLSRKPTDDERQRLAGIVQRSEQPQTGLEDVFWAILNSREFVFNH